MKTRQENLGVLVLTPPACCDAALAIAASRAGAVGVLDLEYLDEPAVAGRELDRLQRYGSATFGVKVAAGTGVDQLLRWRQDHPGLGWAILAGGGAALAGRRRRKPAAGD